MSNLESGMTVYSEEYGGEGKIISMAKNDNGYLTCNIKWKKGILTHMAHEVENFFRAHAVKRFPPKEEVTG